MAFAAVPLARLSVISMRVLSWVGLALVLYASVAYSNDTVFPGLTAIAPVVGTALLLVGGQRRETEIPGLSSRLMVWLGDLSYSWYLWHWPFVVFARQLVNGAVITLLIASLLSLIPAAISYHFVEQPFRVAARWSGWRAVGLAAACILVPAASSSGLAFAADHHWGSSQVKAIAEQNSLHADIVRGCDGISISEPGCRWSTDGARGTAILLGDSNAGHFTEPFVAAANNQGLDAVVSTLHGCPFADVALARNAGDGRECRRSVNESVRQAIAAKPEIIVLASASDLYINEPGTMTFEGLGPASDRQGKAQRWGAGLAEIVERISSKGIRVVIVNPIPHLEDWSLAQCSLTTILRDHVACASSISLADSAELRSLAVEAENAALSGLTAVSVVDFADAICPGGQCQTLVGQQWVYRDGAHLSVPGSLALTDAFEQAIAAPNG